MRQRRRQADQAERDLAADQIGDQLAAAAVRHVLDVEPAGLLLEQLAGEVLRRGGARRAEGELAGLALGELDQLLQRIGLQRRVRDDQVRAEDRVGDRRKVLDRIMVELGVHRRRDHVDVGVHEQRVAVGRGARHVVGADQAAAAGAVLHDHLVERVRHDRGHRARGQVHRAAGGERDDQIDRLALERELLGGRSDRKQGQDRGGQNALHGSLLLSSRRILAEFV